MTVSVVIPTRGRPALLARALRSALGQTYRQLEVIVVVDGPDAETEELLRGYPDERLRWLVNAEPMGAAAARNRGVEEARGAWIAFLDDDDEWLPRKLERQLALVDDDAADVVVSCRIITRTPAGDYVEPKHSPRPDEDLSEYLFSRRRLVTRGGRIQTSALLTSRELALRVRWDPALRRYQDTDWILRASAAGARLLIAPETLSIWHVEERRGSIGTRHAQDWRYALEWIAARRQLVSPRAYAGFVLVRAASLAAAADNRPSARLLWREARRHGRPAAPDVLFFALKMLVPPSVRRALRTRLARRPDDAGTR